MAATARTALACALGTATIAATVAASDAGRVRAAPTPAATPATTVAPPVDFADPASLSAERKVAQLLLVAVYAPDSAAPLDEIAPLAVELGIGGIVLQTGSNVFVNRRGEPLPAHIAQLTADIQRAALTRPDGVPLFIAVDHEGNGAPLTHLREGFTALPSAMAIGATWDPANAAAIGEITGRELAAVGVNVVLGPVLDVLASTHVDNGGDIGTRAFGGHPYWVGRMGSAYVAGVHAGSGGRVLTVAKHFPGHGGSDRLPDQDVSVVTKDFASLETIELPPFGDVTTDPPGGDAAASTDALMTAHIRYRGLSRNSQQASLPVSFDRQGLATLFALEHFRFGAWHSGGGLVVSDSLGVPAVKRWFDPSGRTFPHRQIAREALMAGNDVLILAQFAQRNAWQEMRANIDDTVLYFADAYRRDPAFRLRVDTALARVLAAKRRLYPSWSAERVAAKPDAVASDGAVGGEAGREVVQRIVGQGLTAWTLPEVPPGRGDRIVLIHPERRNAQRLLTDDGGPLACPLESCGLSDADWQRLSEPGPTLLEGTVLARYGRQGAGLIAPEDIRSYALCQIEQALSPALDMPAGAEAPPGDGTDLGAVGAPPPTSTGDGAASTATPAPTPPPALFGCDPALDTASVLAELEAADWIVVAFGELEPEAIRALRGQILPQLYRIAAVHEGRIGVLSFGPPYYVDETNAARLDAHISAYTRLPAAIDAAVAALFGDGTPSGRSPVTVEEAGYDLADRLDPDPALPLVLTAPDPGDGPPPRRITLRVGPVIDANGNPVPDGTIVDLSSDPAGALDPAGSRILTKDGVAQATVTLLEGGSIVVHARSGAAAEAEPLRIDVPQPPTAVPAAMPAAPGGRGRETGPAAVVAGAAGPGPIDLLAALATALTAAMGLAIMLRADRGAAAGRALIVASVSLAGYCGYASALRFGAVDRPPGWAAGVDSLVVAGAGAVVGMLAVIVGSWWRRDRALADD
ncbi:MAG: hypothetical protein IT332_03885 [Ardenticatenales bacterium]|nr:hypothetical protein [Ardenticatenales bacterium]